MSKSLRAHHAAMPPRNPRGGTAPVGCDPGWLPLIGGATLAAVAIAAYCRSFSVPLLYDDYYTIVDNATIRHWSTAFWPPTNTTAGGRPILNLSLALNYAIGGTAVWSYHAVNLAIHVLAGLALFGIVRQTLAGRACASATPIGFGAALLWMLHPLQTESVTYIVQRAESLMGLFYLLTVYCFIRGVSAERADAGGPRACRASRAWFALSVAACLLGMGTKEVMVSAPLIVLLYDRTFAAGSFREAWRRRWGFYLSLGATWLPLAALVAGAGWDRSGTSGFDVGISPWAYWLTQFEALTRYLWLSVWPHPLVFEYGTFWVRHPAEVATYALMIAGLAAAVAVALWRRPVPGFLGAWFFVILAPTSVMPGRIQMIVEHRMYLPLAAVVVAGVVGLHAVLERQRDHGPRTTDNGPRTTDNGTTDNGQRTTDNGTTDHGTTDNGPRTTGPTIADNGPQEDPTTRRRTGCLVVCGLWSCGPVVGGPAVPMVLLLSLGLGALTVQRNEDYRSELTIWSDTVARRPDNERALVCLGNALLEVPGRADDAIARFEAALRLNPDYAEAHNNLGNALNAEGRIREAIAQYETALRLKPDYAEAHYNLGLALANTPAQMDAAIAEYEKALQIQPEYAKAHNNLGNALGARGRFPEAISHYEAALRLKPDDAVAHYNLGNALNAIGRPEQAVVQYEEALRLQPDYVEAHTNLGCDLAQVPGRLADAIAQFEAALRLKPDDAVAHLNLAVALLRTPGRGDEAAAHLEIVLRLQPGNEAARKVLERIRASRP